MSRHDAASRNGPSYGTQHTLPILEARTFCKQCKLVSKRRSNTKEVNTNWYLEKSLYKKIVLEKFKIFDCSFTFNTKCPSPQVNRDRDVDESTGPSARAVLAATARLAAPPSPRRSPIRGGKNAIRPANTIYRGVYRSLS